MTKLYRAPVGVKKRWITNLKHIKRGVSCVHICNAHGMPIREMCTYPTYTDMTLIVLQNVLQSD
jgi:hypothetical protein